MGSAIASDKLPKSVEFYNKYKKIYGKELQAGHGPAPAYESVYILAEAIERAGSLDPDAVAAQIKKTDRMGIMGRIRSTRATKWSMASTPRKPRSLRYFNGPTTASARIVFPESLAEAKSSCPRAEACEMSLAKACTPRLCEQRKAWLDR